MFFTLYFNKARNNKHLFWCCFLSTTTPHTTAVSTDQASERREQSSKGQALQAVPSLPGSPGIHKLHCKLSTKSTTQLEIKWTKPGLSIPLHHPQQQHLLNYSFNQSSDQCGDHFIKKASSKDICNSVDAGPEMTSICPALSMPKQHEVWLSCHCRPVRKMHLNSPFLLSRNCHGYEKKDPLYPHTHQKHGSYQQIGNCSKSSEFVQSLFSFKTSGTCSLWTRGKSLFIWGVGKENPVVGQEALASIRQLLPLGL